MLLMRETRHYLRYYNGKNFKCERRSFSHLTLIFDPSFQPNLSAASITNNIQPQASRSMLALFNQFKNPMSNIHYEAERVILDGGSQRKYITKFGPDELGNSKRLITLLFGFHFSALQKNGHRRALSDYVV